MREEGLLDTQASSADDNFDAGLRPREMTQFVGHADLKERLSILIEAAQSRSEPVDHVLFSGPPGLGKTSLAGIVAHAMGANFRATSGPALERPGDLAAVLTNLNAGDVLFIDEIHRLPRQVEEVLYPAMEDYQLDIVVHPDRSDHEGRTGRTTTARPLRLCGPARLLRGERTGRHRRAICQHPRRRGDR